MKPESKLWQLVRKNLPDIHWTRIESWVNQGVPDCYGILDGTSVFVELKVTRSNKINLSPFQQNWLYNHYLHGGRSFIMLQHLEQRLLRVFPSSILHSPLRITSEPQLKVSYTGPAAGAAWARVQQFLLHSPLAEKPEDPPL